LQHYLAFEDYVQSPDIGSPPDTSPQSRLTVGAA
jgi:hypothetical protein